MTPGDSHPRQSTRQIADAEPFLPRAFSAAWQQVTCTGCGKRYRCTPAQDYYHEPSTPDAERTLENGYCMTCLCIRAKVHPDRVVNPDGSPA